MTRRAVVTLLTAAGLGAAVPTAVSGPTPARLVIREQAPGSKVFRSVPITQGSEIAMTWMHSVDKTPWWEYYRAVEDGLILESTELALMGAGTPFNAPKTELVGDMIRLSGLDEHFSAVRWIHSHRVHHRIYLDDQLLLPTRAIGHHVLAEMTVIGEPAT